MEVRAAGKIAFTAVRRHYRLFDIQSAIIIMQPDIALKAFTRENSAARASHIIALLNLFCYTRRSNFRVQSVVLFFSFRFICGRFIIQIRNRC